jgi:tetraacyldisaccharide 4'-kinase
MKWLRFLLMPFALIYGAVGALRNALFSWHILPVKRVDIPVISVGNLSVGGTGKTPHVKRIVEELIPSHRVAILLRGYGRNTKGFLRVSQYSRAESVGDEALLYKSYFGDRIEVVVCENRYDGAQRIRNQFPEVECIVLDDAYQHRSLHRDCNILLDDVTHPSHRDFVLPAGNLREFGCGRRRADLVVLTKVPSAMSSQAAKTLRNNYPVKIPVFTSRILYGEICGMARQPLNIPDQIILVTGIANAKPLREHLEKLAPVHHLEFPDHHQFTHDDIRGIHEIFGKFAPKDAVMITTAKDAMRLMQPELRELIEGYPWFVQHIEVQVEGDNMDWIIEIKKYL